MYSVKVEMCMYVKNKLYVYVKKSCENNVDKICKFVNTDNNGLKMGHLYLHSSCMHLYKTDIEQAEACIKEPVRHIEPVINSKDVNSLKSILFNLRETGFEWPKTK